MADISLTRTDWHVYVIGPGGPYAASVVADVSDDTLNARLRAFDEFEACQEEMASYMEDGHG